MKYPHFINQPISVQAQIDGEQLSPQHLTWQSSHYTAVSIGRQWTTEGGRHVLVELHEGSRMEILFTPNFTWRLLRFWPREYMA